MISKSCDLRGFLEAVRDKDYRDVLYLAEKEATEAERPSYQQKQEEELGKQAKTSYAKILKDFMFFMRYGVRPAGLTDSDFHLFRLVCEEVEKKANFRHRCSMFF